MHTVQKIPVMTFYPHVYALFSFIYLIFVVLTSSRRQLLLVCVKEVLEMYKMFNLTTLHTEMIHAYK